MAIATIMEIIPTAIYMIMSELVTKLATGVAVGGDVGAAESTAKAA